MAYCDYCGTSYHGGSIQSGSFQFCSRICHDRGAALSLLDEIAAIKVQDYIESIYAGPCPMCNRNAHTDLHPYYQITSMLLYTKRSEHTQFSCRRCGRKRQIKEALRSFAAGWWGVPWGLVFTPIQILRNLFVILCPVDRIGPSRELRRVGRLQFASHLEKSASQALPFPR